jgi:3-hydroxyisobutyrate dehydrogenase-like beta-hydroxyacid dehydrogenase
MANPAIGFLGLGTMGGQMARRLVASGYDVTGYDIDPARLNAAVAAGVPGGKSPAAVAERADVVLSSLTDPAAVRRAYLGPDGAVTALRSGTTLIDLSTIDPDTWLEVAAAAKARGAECLDAPVSGGPADAGSGGLVFMVGGEAAVLERCRPVLQTLARELHHVGALGSGYVVKLVNNVMSMGNMVVAAEAMVLGVRAGMEPERLFEILKNSGGRSHHFLKRMPNVLAGDFTPYFSIALSRKDVGLALGLADRLGVPMPVTSAVRQIYQTATACGMEQLDMAAVTRLYEQWAGVQVRATGSARSA